MLDVKPEGRRAVGRCSGRSEYDIKMYLVEILRLWFGFIWIGVGTNTGLLSTR
jgi:hypothetical protein